MTSRLPISSGLRSVSPAISVDLLAIVADPAGREGRVGARDLGGELLQRHAVKREPLRVGGDADHLAGLADEIGQADVLDLGDLGAQLAGDAGQVVRR